MTGDLLSAISGKLNLSQAESAICASFVQAGVQARSAGLPVVLVAPREVDQTKSAYRESLREKLCVKRGGTLGCVRADLTHPTGYGLLFTAWAAALGQINVMLAVARADGATEAGVSRSWPAVKAATALRGA